MDHRNLISLTGSPGGGQGNSVTLPGNANVGLLPPMQKPGLLPTPPVMPQGAGLWQQPPPQGGNNVSGGCDSDFRGNYTNAMQQQGIPPPPMPPGMTGYFGGPGNVRICSIANKLS